MPRRLRIGYVSMEMVSDSHTPPTLAKVARHAGVSPITVSRVVRTPAIVAPETRERVLSAMRDLGYVHNLVAGSLASSRTRMVAVLVPTINNAIFAETVHGLAGVLDRQGYAVMLAQSRYDLAREESILSGLLSRRPEALVMIGSPATEAGATMLRQARIPVVETWDIPERPIDAVAGFDNAGAGAAVARHFAERGRKSLAFVGFASGRATRRWEGFRAGALAAGLPEPRRIILQRGGLAGALALAQLGGIDAIFTANDAHAIGLLAALRDAGHARPGPQGAQPVAVIGLGNTEIGRLVSPRLTTVSVNGGAIGRVAAALTLDRARPRKVDMGFELVLRESG